MKKSLCVFLLLAIFFIVPMSTFAVPTSEAYDVHLTNASAIISPRALDEICLSANSQLTPIYLGTAAGTIPFTVNYCYSQSGRYAQISSVSFGSPFNLAAGYSLSGTSYVNGSNATVSCIVYKYGSYVTTVNASVQVTYTGNCYFS